MSGSVRSAGITGHQNLKGEDWVRRTLDRIIAEEKVEFGLTSLAQGADQLFANCLLDAGLGFRAIVPSMRYEEAFEDEPARAVYAQLLSKAADVEVLGFSAPSEAAFFAVGKRIVEEASILIAVWDGAPAKGLGGTGDVVEYARSRGKRVIHIDCVHRVVSVL